MARENIMDSIIITVNLPGIIEGNVKHVGFQKHTALLSEDEGGSITKMIKHTDRKELPSARIMPVSAAVVTGWTQGDCPFWEEARNWRKMSPVQKVISHVARFDEGNGVGFEFLGDGEE